MEYRELGTTGMTVSAVGFGCWAMGGGWGPMDDKLATAAVRRAIDLGINLFDTANIYGMGHSERILGKALGKRRRDVIVATKVGLHMDSDGCLYRSGSALHITRAVEQSLKLLRTDYIDLYQMHWPDLNTPFEEMMGAMEGLVKAGKVRFIGVSNFTVPQLRECIKAGRVHTLQPPYSLLMPESGKSLLPFCAKNGVGVLGYGTLAYGLLTGKYGNRSTFGAGDWRSGTVFPDPGEWQRHIDLFQGKGAKRNLRIVRKLESYAKSLGTTVGRLAIAWVLGNPAVSTALVGAKTPQQVEDNAAAAELRLTRSQLREISGIAEGTS